MAQLDGVVAYGIRPGFGLFARIPVRLVRDRVHYEDLARQPYTPPNPDRHHRNETLTGLADPQISVHAGREVGMWKFGGKLGVSVPLGRTEPNPFELGRLGLPHQHVQFGTGTWGPIVEAGAARPIGAVDMTLTGVARFTTANNDHGYQAGNRYALMLDGSHWPTKVWGVDGGVAILREEPETWNDQIETEGNLGRFDVLASLGATRAATGAGTIHVALQFPLHSHSRGHQMDIPLILRVDWSP